jgi:hypothetical protein
MLSRGQQINGGIINNLNKVACALQINNGSVASYLSDESALMGGCEKLKYVLSNGSVPVTVPFYQTIVDSPYNLLPSDTVANGGIAPPTGNTLKDALGFLTSKGVYLVLGLVMDILIVIMQQKMIQTVSIPLSTLSPFFDATEMLPLFLCKEAVIELFFAPPAQTFCSSIAVVATGVSSPVRSFTVSNLKVCYDLITCSDVLNDVYKLKASSSEGLIITYDDYAISTKT